MTYLIIYCQVLRITHSENNDTENNTNQHDVNSAITQNVSSFIIFVYSRSVSKTCVIVFFNSKNWYCQPIFTVFIKRIQIISSNNNSSLAYSFSFLYVANSNEKIVYSIFKQFKFPLVSNKRTTNSSQWNSVLFYSFVSCFIGLSQLCG